MCSMRRRLFYLAEQWRKGVRFKKLFFLVGQRKLDPIMESSEIVLNSTGKELFVKKDWHLNDPFPLTEFDAAKLVYQQIDDSLAMCVSSG